jgi:hypothetical protein
MKSIDPFYSKGAGEGGARSGDGSIPEKPQTTKLSLTMVPYESFWLSP